MKLRVYKGDWFFNMGIVGFLNILNEAEVKNKVIIDEDYIEFDSELLIDFHNYYFDYFMKMDNMNKSISRNIDTKVAYIKSNPNKIKDIVNQLKQEIQYQNTKVKKYFPNDSNEISDLLKNLKEIKNENDFEKLDIISKSCKSIFGRDYINEKLTLNKSRSYIGGDFFGQVSFLQRTRASLNKNEQATFIYRDYISNIVEYSRLNDLVIDGDIDILHKYIEDKKEDKTLSNTIISIYKNISKLLKKNKSISVVHGYLHSDILDSCEMCYEHKGIVSTYTEGNFGPLAVSADNAQNMYWNMNRNLHICDICKLILLCTPAGTVYTKKYYIENEDNEFYSFVNMDTSIDEIYNANINLKKLKDRDNPFNDLVIDIVSENKEKSEWQLQNILFVEFKASIEAKKCKMNYFNMPTYLAKFFANESGKNSKLIQSIYNSRFKANTVDILLKNKDLKHLISKCLRDKIKGHLEDERKNNISSSDIYKSIKIRSLINNYKKGVYEMNDKKLQVVKFAGHEIHNYYVNSNSKNKINGVAYKLLNAIKVGNKKDFMDTVLRIFMSAEKSVPSVFIEIMAEKDLDFESIGHAFITGLISEKYEANKETNKVEGK
ncbi:MAG: type I-B CRISPR-associated protein Cas8b1/Cst1 [Peptostreptococcaceae bacterium]